MHHRKANLPHMQRQVEKSSTHTALFFTFNRLHIIAEVTSLSVSEPDMRGSLMERALSIRRSIRLGSKKSKDKTPTNTVPQASFEEKIEEEVVTDEQEVCQEMEEEYTLQEIPHTPLSGTVYCQVQCTCQYAFKAASYAQNGLH